VYLTGVHLLQVCISYRCASLTGVHLLQVCISYSVHLLQACISYRCASLTGVHLLQACISYRRISLDVYLTGAHLLQAYILQACISGGPFYSRACLGRTSYRRVSLAYIILPKVVCPEASISDTFAAQTEVAPPKHPGFGVAKLNSNMMWASSPLLRRSKVGAFTFASLLCTRRWFIAVITSQMPFSSHTTLYNRKCLLGLVQGTRQSVGAVLLCSW
jgi:hypothetical protein